MRVACALGTATLLLVALGACDATSGAPSPTSTDGAGSDGTGTDGTGTDGAGTGAEAGPDAPEPTPTSTMPEYDGSTTAGELAPGFPADLLPVPDGADLLASSASSGPDGTDDTDDTDGVWQSLTLNLRTEASAESIVELYTEVLTEADFSVSPSDALSALDAHVTFVRPLDDAGGGSVGDGDEEQGGRPTAETVVVGVLDDETTRLVTISGRVLAAGSG